MRIDNEVQLSRPWRIHSVLGDFTLEDVWALPAICGGEDDFGSVIEMAARSDPTSADSAPTRVLWGVRDRLGGWFDLGRISTTASKNNRLPIPGTREFSVADRLPKDLRGSANDVHFEHLPFVPLYRTQNEFAAEISNQTVHGVMHLPGSTAITAPTRRRWRSTSNRVAGSVVHTWPSSSLFGTGSCIPRSSVNSNMRGAIATRRSD